MNIPTLVRRLALPLLIALVPSGVALAAEGRAATDPASAVQPLKPPGAAIASAHALATDAGMEVLADGGNAFDAAIAVSAVLSVVEPISSASGVAVFFPAARRRHRSRRLSRRSRDLAGRGYAGALPRRRWRIRPRPRHQRRLVGGHPGIAGRLRPHPGEVRQAAAVAHAGAGDPHRARGLPGVRAHGPRLCGTQHGDGALPRHPRGLPGRRPANRDR